MSVGSQRSVGIWRLICPVRLPPPGTRARHELVGVTALLALAIAVLSVPGDSIAQLGGSLADPEGRPIVPTLSFLLGSACLAGALWAVLRALPKTRAAGLAVALFAVVAVAQFGGVTRTVLQLATLHHFYLRDNPPGARAASEYWGITLVVIAGLAFVLPLAVAVANLLPQAHGPARYRAAVVRMAGRRHFLLLPIAAAGAIVGICAILPSSLSDSLGYSSPTLEGSRLIFPVGLLENTVWQSFARVAFLPLLVGMWEGMESARAFFTIAERNRLCRSLASAFDYRLLALAALLGGGVLALAEGIPLLIPGTIVLCGLVALATGGIAERVSAIPSMATVGARVGVAEDWRDGAPIGRVLVVLAAPALVPLCVDLWHGLEGPFRLQSELGGYIYFWREFGIDQVSSVSVAGIFGHGMDQIALYSAGLIAFLLAGALFNVLFLRDNVKGLGKLMWLLVPIAAIAIALVPIIEAASHPYAAFVVGAGALPALLVMDSSPERNRMIALFVVALGLLAAWSYAVWHFDWLPPFAVLLATILWRFVIDARGLNTLEEQLRTRRIAAFAALALLGLGMLVLSHGSQAGVLDSASFSDVTDRIAVAVIAPIWLVHYAVAHVRRAMAGEAGS
jgi:hypothetical protein